MAMRLQHMQGCELILTQFDTHKYDSSKQNEKIKYCARKENHNVYGSCKTDVFDTYVCTFLTADIEHDLGKRCAGTYPLHRMTRLPQGNPAVGLQEKRILTCVGVSVEVGSVH